MTRAATPATRAPSESAHAAAQAFSPRRRTWAFVVVAMAFVMDLMDVTILHVALPAVGQGLAAGAAALQWAVAGYALAFAMGVITGGRLGDVFGYRRVFLAGVAAFTFTSLLCGLAQAPWQLVGARVLQGASAALMVPQVMSLLQVMYAPHERLRVFTIFGLLGGASSTLGPVLGGWLVQANLAGLGWRMAFFINLPVGLLAGLAGARLLPAGAGAHPKALDLGGTALVAATLLALMLPLIQGPEQGWPAWCLLLLAAVPLLGAWTLHAWRRRQARDGSALVDPALLRRPSVRRGLLATLALTGIVPAYLLVLSFAVQGGLGAAPQDMAALCVPISLGAALSVALLTRRVVPRLGQATVPVGALVQGLALAWAGFVMHRLLAAPAGAAALHPGLLGAHALLGLGIGFIGPPLSTATLKDVPLAEAGSASGVIGAARQLATALALALAGGLMFLGRAPGADPGAMQQGLLRVLPALGLLLVLGAVAHLAAPGRQPPDGA